MIIEFLIKKSYWWLEIVGYIIIPAIFIAAVSKGIKYISTINRFNVKQGVLIVGIALLPLVLFLGLTFLDRVIWTPTVHFDNIGTLIIGGITLLIVIGISIWAKTWILIIVTTLLILPDYFLNLTPLKHKAQLILSMIISFGGIAVYLWILSKLEKSKWKLTITKIVRRRLYMHEVLARYIWMVSVVGVLLIVLFIGLSIRMLSVKCAMDEEFC